MIQGTPAPGRPYYVALVPRDDTLLEVKTTFYSAVKRLRYREQVALARALHTTPRTVAAWHYGARFPKWEVMLMVIQWHKNGKPMAKHYQQRVLARGLL